MRKQITTKLVENLRANTGRRVEVRDTLLPGFGIRVSSAGSKTWFVSRRAGGRQIRQKIGNYPLIPLSDARVVARQILRDAQLGEYLASGPKPVTTLEKAISDFIELYAKPKNRSWKAQAATLKKFSSLNRRAITDITRGDIARILDQITAQGHPIAANRAMSAIKKLFSWAVDRGVVQTHPLLGMKAPSKVRSRDRILSDDEIRSFWSAAEELGYPFGPLLQLLLLTGQRRGEAGRMKWADLNLEAAIWTIPASISKNGRLHEVPLTPSAVKILQDLPQFQDATFVFTTTGKTPVSGFGRIKRRLDQLMGASDWTIHDLRRTVASGLARLTVAPHIIEKLLNHVSGEISGVAAIYNRHGYSEEKRKAIGAWETHIERLIGKEGSHLQFDDSRNTRRDVRTLVPRRAQPVARPFH